MSVGAGDAERGDGGAAGMTSGLPRDGFVQEPEATGRPVDMRRWGLRVERPGQHPVLQREHHLDDAGHARSGLGVAEVGLEAAEPQRLVDRVGLAVGGEQRVGLDRIAERGAGAVRFDGVDVAGR